jgi:hypothetical protein
VKRAGADIVRRDRRWNTWVPELRVLAINEENEALRMKLRRENALTSSQGSKEKMTMPEVSTLSLERCSYHQLSVLTDG